MDRLKSQPRAYGSGRTMLPDASGRDGAAAQQAPSTHKTGAKRAGKAVVHHAFADGELSAYHRVDDDAEADSDQSAPNNLSNTGTHAAGALGKRAQSFVDLIPVYEKQAGEWMRKHRPGFPNLKKVKEALPLLSTPRTWTTEDRNKAATEWQNHPLRKRMLGHKGNKPMLTLYKTSLAIMSCLPEDIIGVDTRLEYDLSTDKATMGEPSLLWSGGFCAELTQLLPHFMWGGDHRFLAMAIQYVVMLRTQDVRPWEGDGPLMDDQYPQLVRQAIRREWPAEGIQRIRAGLDSDRKSLGFRSRGIWCLLFDAIDAQMTGPRTKVADTQRLSCPVDTKDLQALRKALDSLGSLSAGHPALMPVSLACHVVNRRRFVKTETTGASWLAFRDYALLREYEKECHARLTAASVDGSLDTGRSRTFSDRSEVSDPLSESSERDTFSLSREVSLSRDSGERDPFSLPREPEVNLSLDSEESDEAGASRASSESGPGDASDTDSASSQRVEPSPVTPKRWRRVSSESSSNERRILETQPRIRGQLSPKLGSRSATHSDDVQDHWQGDMDEDDEDAQVTPSRQTFWSLSDFDPQVTPGDMDEDDEDAQVTPSRQTFWALSDLDPQVTPPVAKSLWP